jgi:hypothetical protein
MCHRRNLTARVLVFLAAANLVLPFSLLPAGSDVCRAQAGDGSGLRGKKSLAAVAVCAARSGADASGSASVERSRGKADRELLRRAAVAVKHRLHRDRATETRTKFACDELSPFAGSAAGYHINVAFAAGCAGHVDRRDSTPDRCIAFSRFLL